MIRWTAVGVGFFGLVAACSSAADECTIAGTYAATQKLDATAANTCGVKTDDATTTVTVSADGEVAFQGVTGSCPGSIDACKLTAVCNGSTSTGGHSTLQLSWTFNKTGFSGSTALGIEGAGPGGTDSCAATVTFSGTRK